MPNVSLTFTEVQQQTSQISTNQIFSLKRILVHYVVFFKINNCYPSVIIICLRMHFCIKHPLCINYGWNCWRVCLFMFKQLYEIFIFVSYYYWISFDLWFWCNVNGFGLKKKLYVIWILFDYLHWFYYKK